jgi:arabinofuranosyltransferase
MIVYNRLHADLPRRGERVDAILLTGSCFLIFTYVFLANSWIGDDAYITFRVVDNFVNGYGLTFNPDERVQAYTHPLWTLLLSVLYAVTSDLFFTTLIVSYAFCALAIAVALRHLGEIWRGAVFLGLLLSSKAFVDYTSSGLEYPLSYLLLVLFYCRFFAVTTDRTAPPLRDLVWLGLIASLAFLNRSDSILLYCGPLLYLVRRSWPLSRQPLLRLSMAFSPVILWLGFSYLYYGFPFPNTYYAKVATGIPRGLQWRQGLAYVLNSINFDPFTLATVALGAGVAVRARWIPEAAAAASAWLYVFYTISVGGDFMSGRFFAMPFLVCALLIARAIRRPETAAVLGAALVVYSVVAPLAPIKTRANYPDGAWAWRLQNGIKDERGHYHQTTNVLFYAPFANLPDHLWFREGASFRSSPEKTSVQGSIGFFGFNAGPTKYVIDRNALSDPLLARLPVSESIYFEFYAGHFFREMPAGYVESRREGRNLLVDSLLHDYYGKLLNVTAGPIFSWSRARDIWELNFGRYRRLHALVDERRPVFVSVAADNDRFRTDIGVRNTRGEGTLITSGAREGYLQLGPGIPLKAGAFAARWVGTTGAAAGQPLGFVEVLADGRLVNRRDVFAGEFSSADKVLAELPFVLEEPAAGVDYRLYVRRGVSVVLERISLESTKRD